MYAASCPTLFRDKWSATRPRLEDSIASVNADTLANEYKKLRKIAPRRRTVGKAYFVGHSGTPSSRGSSNRLEEHYAMALWNLERRWPRRGGGWQRFLDYQVPLKAMRADHGIGKIDLLGITDRGRFIVVELKCPRSGRGQSPAYALMEGLRYAAIVEANLHPLASDARKRFGCKTDAEAPPIVQVLGPISWWNDWLDPGLKNRAAGNWSRPFAKLASAFETRTGVTVECLATDTNIAEVADKLRQRRPSLNPPPTFHAVHLDRNPPEYEPLQ